MRTNSQHKSAFFFPVFCLSYHFDFSFDTQNLPPFVTVIMLSRCQSAVDCRNINAEDNCVHSVKYHYFCHFPGLGFM